MRCPVGAESADARNADDCTQQNQERTDDDSGRVENGGVENRSDNERGHSEKILGADPPAIL